MIIVRNPRNVLELGGNFPNSYNVTSDFCSSNILSFPHHLSRTSSMTIPYCNSRHSSLAGSSRRLPNV